MFAEYNHTMVSKDVQNVKENDEKFIDTFLGNFKVVSLNWSQ